MELKSVFAAYGEKPLLFLWGSLLYVFFSLIVLLSTIGILLVSFLLLFFFGYLPNFDTPLNLILYALPTTIALLFMLYMNGCITAATIYAYKNATNGTVISLIDFYHYGLSRGPMMFSIGVLRDFFMFIVIGVGTAIYYYGLQGFEYGTHILAIYTLMVLFVFHLITKPGIIACGLGERPFESFKKTYLVFAKKHIYFIVFFTMYAFVWLMNFIPILQFISLFVLFPLSYSALIKMVEEIR
ncbi:MAG: hypothetical protein QW153_02280 [Candidatus Bilamarchaeaceae archaeon]